MALCQHGARTRYEKGGELERKERHISMQQQNNNNKRSVDDYTIHVKGGSSLIKKCEELSGCNLFTAILRQLGALSSESCHPLVPPSDPTSPPYLDYFLFLLRVTHLFVFCSF